MDALAILSAAASNVFPGARVSIDKGFAQVYVTRDDKVTDMARSPINPAMGGSGVTEAVASCIMQIARNRFFSIPVHVEEPAHAE